MTATLTEGGVFVMPWLVPSSLTLLFVLDAANTHSVKDSTGQARGILWRAGRTASNQREHSTGQARGILWRAGERLATNVNTPWGKPMASCGWLRDAPALPLGTCHPDPAPATHTNHEQTGCRARLVAGQYRRVMRRVGFEQRLLPA